MRTVIKRTKRLVQRQQPTSARTKETVEILPRHSPPSAPMETLSIRHENFISPSRRHPPPFSSLFTSSRTTKPPPHAQPTSADETTPTIEKHSTSPERKVFNHSPPPVTSMKTIPSGRNNGAGRGPIFPYLEIALPLPNSPSSPRITLVLPPNIPHHASLRQTFHLDPITEIL